MQAGSQTCGAFYCRNLAGVVVVEDVLQEAPVKGHEMLVPCAFHGASVVY